MPRLQQHDFSLAAMPVQLGRADQASSSAASLVSVAKSLPLFACAAMPQSSLTYSSTGLDTDEEDTTQLGSGTSSSLTELHFCKTQQLEDVHCSMPPPLPETWERVGVDLRRPTRRRARCTTAWGAYTIPPGTSLATETPSRCSHGQLPAS
ncbi:hypothetical protein COO60DRAFT_180437 [Scenedesmus sp. NREL 46B-D3]|nr:hypothetical protein COO60DRAFT_180437 [Scenedesmus sp. NREL 46B-D3]